jgi:hypothetical protein
MSTNNTNRDYQFLASAIALVSGYFAIRACFVLPKAANMLSELGEMDGAPGFERLLFEHSLMPLPIMALAFVVTVLSIWIRYRFSSLVAALGIVFMAVGAHLILSTSMAPLFRMITLMGEY